MPHWVVTITGAVSGPMEELDARIEQTRLIGKGGDPDKIIVVKAANKDEARKLKP